MKRKGVPDFRHIISQTFFDLAGINVVDTFINFYTSIH